MFITLSHVYKRGGSATNSLSFEMIVPALSAADLLFQIFVFPDMATSSRFIMSDVFNVFSDMATMSRSIISDVFF